MASKIKVPLSGRRSMRCCRFRFTCRVSARRRRPLPTPEHLEQAIELVTPEMVETSVPCGARAAALRRGDPRLRRRRVRRALYPTARSEPGRISHVLRQRGRAAARPLARTAQPLISWWRIERDLELSFLAQTPKRPGET